MMENLRVIELASAMARHATVRHRVIAENVANADTPGYRARAVEDFAKMVNEGFHARATRPQHISTAPAAAAGVPRLALSDAPSAPDGNSVNLADQSRQAVEASGQHRLATTIYKKSVDILRIGLGPNR